MRGRMLAVTALSSVLLAAVASAAAGAPAAYTRAATEACLASLPGAIVGLPPASPPIAPALFVDALPRDDLLTWAFVQSPRRPHRQLAIWYGAGRAYEGIVLSFFKNVADARISLKSIGGLYGGELVRNVVASRDQKQVPSASVRKSIFGCLRSHPRPGGVPRRPAPAATLATFAGAWGGHTRGLSITASGRGDESADDGCCSREYRLTFRIVSVSGTLTRATALYRVLGFMRYEGVTGGIRVGELGKLVLKDGIVTNTLTDDYFCSGPGWATGACGA